MSKSFNSLSRLSGQRGAMPSSVQRRYLSLGLKQAGGKLPLFDKNGQQVKAATIRACMSAGWCKPWFANPIEPSAIGGEKIASKIYNIVNNSTQSIQFYS